MGTAVGGTHDAVAQQGEPARERPASDAGMDGDAAAGGAMSDPARSHPAAIADGQDVPLGRSSAEDFQTPAGPVVIDMNIGKGFEVAWRHYRHKKASCARTYPQRGQNPRRYSLYRPKELREGQRYPVVIWANSRCVDPDDERALLSWMASYGMMIIAPNSHRAPPGRAMDKAMAWLMAAGSDRQGPYNKRFDMSQVGAVGVAGGAEAAVALAHAHEHINTVVLLDGPTAAGKAFLTVSNDHHAGKRQSRFRKAIRGATHEAAFLWLRDTHKDTTILQEALRLAPFVSAWLRHRLLNDPSALHWLKDARCDTCGSYRFYRTQG